MKAFLLFLVAAFAAGCANANFSSGEGALEEAPCTAGATRCQDNNLQSCNDNGGWEVEQECASLVCNSSTGCVQCTPGLSTCAGSDVMGCDDEGKFTGVLDTCDASSGQQCFAGQCESACDVAANTASYIACEYWPTVTINNSLGGLGGGFDFAVAVSNPQSVAVDITITRGGQTVEEARVLGGAVATIPLPWVPELKQAEADGYTDLRSVLVDGGAYRLVSSMPVSVYQFNPLQFESSSGGCGGFLGQSCSYTNDASLLLPTSALRREHIVISRPSWTIDNLPANPGFFSVVGTEDGTELSVRFSAHTEAGSGDGLAAFGPGETATFQLDQGDVLQILSSVDFTAADCADAFGYESCHGGEEYDLTGTRIDANNPVAVFGGHACTFVPFGVWACDHLEEQMFPLSTWGANIIAVSTEPLVSNEPNVFRVVSGSDDNEITFEPDVHSTVTLDAGEFIEFEHQGAFEARAAGRIAVAQFMVGEDYNGGLEPPDVGDPAMGLVVPYEQFRTSYDFLTPSTYTVSYVNVIAAMDAPPTLDGEPLRDLVPIGNSGFGYERVLIAPGAHHIESLVDPQGFGIMVSGLASFTSYLYPGGLDLEALPID